VSPGSRSGSSRPPEQALGIDLKRLAFADDHNCVWIPQPVYSAAINALARVSSFRPRNARILNVTAKAHGWRGLLRVTACWPAAKAACAFALAAERVMQPEVPRRKTRRLTATALNVFPSISH